MKLSNKRLVEDANQLGELSQKILPVKVSYAIAKNITKIESVLKIYNNEKAKLLNQYAEKDEKGNIKADDAGQIVFKAECKEQWDKDINDLLAIENEIDIHKFNLSELEGHSMKPSELMLIEYMIEE